MTHNGDRRPGSAEQHLQGKDREFEALREALDGMWVAVAMLSRNGRVVYANRAAAAILQRGVGVSLASDARLLAATGNARSMLVRALEEGDSPVSFAVARLEQPPLVLRLQPLRADLQGAFGAIALLFISDPDAKPSDCTASLRSAYGLTKTEARLVQSLSEGASLKNIATTHRITYETVRTYVRRILSKTGARRQAELVRITHALR
jgi:DNA-binding CsgD family transcriptional regulator